MSKKKKPEEIQLFNRWNKLLQKEGLHSIDFGTSVRPDKIIVFINQQGRGLDLLQDKQAYWEELQRFYWEIYLHKSKILDLYIQGYSSREIRELLHTSKAKIISIIRSFRRSFFKQHKSL